MLCRLLYDGNQINQIGANMTAISPPVDSTSTKKTGLVETRDRLAEGLPSSSWALEPESNYMTRAGMTIHFELEVAAPRRSPSAHF